VTFTGSPLITKSASLLTPTGSNIQAASGSSALLAYLGSGVWQIISYSTPPPATPSVTVYTTGSGTYTTPTGATYIQVEDVGAGSGGGGSGTTTTGGAGGAGGATTFGSLTANGGPATPTSGTGVSPSPATATGGDVNIGGGLGQIPSFVSTGWFQGGIGASSCMGAGASGIGAYYNGTSGVTSGAGAATGYGAGGGGGGPTGAGIVNMGWGGDAGACLTKTIATPSATYSYSVGTAGTAGTAGTSGTAGSPGTGGIIVVTAHF
jgi:hypothetical protein